MKDKKCSTKECKTLISSSMNKSGLCNRCLTKKYKKEHDEEMKAYAKMYKKKYPEKIPTKEEHKLYMKEWRKNPEKGVEYNSKYYDKNSKRIKSYGKDYYGENKEAKIEYTRLYQNKRYREDEGFKMRKKLGGALWKVINHYIQTGKIGNPMKKYGIDWKGIIKQLSPIPKDRHLYHVDHIVPLCKFDLTNIDLIQAAFSPENHRWLLAKENLGRTRKGV